jgi:hypothetical protein
MEITYTLTGDQLWHKVKSVSPLDTKTLLLEFDNKDYRIIDMSLFFKAGSVFERIANDPVLFKQVYVSGRTIEWPDGATLDPDVLYNESLPFNVS